MLSLLPREGSQGLVAALMCPVAFVSVPSSVPGGGVSVIFTPRMLGNRNTVHAEDSEGDVLHRDPNTDTAAPLALVCLG